MDYLKYIAAEAEAGLQVSCNDSHDDTAKHSHLSTLLRCGFKYAEMNGLDFAATLSKDVHFWARRNSFCGPDITDAEMMEYVKGLK